MLMIMMTTMIQLLEGDDDADETMKIEIRTVMLLGVALVACRQVGVGLMVSGWYDKTLLWRAQTSL